MDANKIRPSQKQGEWSYLINSHSYWKDVSFCRYSDNLSLFASGDDYERQRNNDISFRNIFMSSVGYEMSLYEVVMETNSNRDDKISANESPCTSALIKQFTKDYNKKNASKSGFEEACHCFITKNNKYIIATDEDPLIYYNVYDTTYAQRNNFRQIGQSMFIDDKI